MKRNILVILISMLTLVIISCDRPQCHNKNAIFNANEPESEIYKNELIKQIERIGNEHLTFWLDSYEKINGKEYLNIHIQNDSLCATGVFLVNDWNKIEGVRKTQGKGYKGAELVGLTFDIKKDSRTTELVLNSIDRIID